MTPSEPARPAWRSNTIGHILIIFGIALAARFALAMMLPVDDSVFWDQPYWHYARNFAEGRGFWMPNPYSEQVDLPRAYAFRPPLFPFLWGCAYNLTGGAYLPIRTAFAILGALTCVLAYLIGAETVRSKGAAFLGGLFCALYPPLIWHSVHLMTEPMFIFFSVLALYLLFVWRRKGTLRWLVLAGVAAGLATLSRSVLVAFLPVMALWVFWCAGRRWNGGRGVWGCGSMGEGMVHTSPAAKDDTPKGRCSKPWAAGLMHAAVFTAVVTLVMLPWIVRNAIVFHTFVPTTTDAGHGFYVANNPRVVEDPEAASRGFEIPQDWSFVKASPEEKPGEVEISQRLMKMTARWLMDHPKEAAVLMARRFVTLWRFYPNPDFIERKHVLLYAVSYVPIFPFIVLGLWWAHRRAGELLPNLLFIDALLLYTTVIHTVFLAMLRYREPLMPFLLVFGAYGVIEMAGRMGRMRNAD